ncbi:hypothetical protein H8E88_23055 [candidate division KSB1 bacterium]|nr:hypothetical protein [candidate division KSB1 bacterium]
MQAYRTQTKLGKDKNLILENLPFHPSESVEVIILSQSYSTANKNHYPLRGKPVHYIDPTEPVATEDWEALK